MSQENSSDGDWDGYTAEYCENCGRLVSASGEVEESVEEPVHRVDIIEAIGPVEEVGETVAMERGECECTGQIVQRWYTYPAGNVPEPEFTPSEGEMSGRDPNEDALVDLGDGWKEAREVSGIEEGDSIDGQ